MRPGICFERNLYQEPDSFVCKRRHNKGTSKCPTHCQNCALVKYFHNHKNCTHLCSHTHSFYDDF